MIYEKYKEVRYESADKLWEALSPTRDLFKQPCKLLYRGQGSANWRLVPSVLRNTTNNPATIMFGTDISADEQVVAEIFLLEQFAEFCDQIGIRIPGDSITFRENVLTSQKQDLYYKRPSLWPNPKLIEIMALAQHHGVPTRLLDWTRQPFAAAYFAASSALSNLLSWENDEFLAVWVLNIEQIALYPKIKVVKVPGSVSPYVSAQSGLFTLQQHKGARGEVLTVTGLEDEFATLSGTPLMKLTIPIKESIRLYSLCLRAGFSGAKIYPSADGAGKAVVDGINWWAALKRYNKTNAADAG